MNNPKYHIYTAFLNEESSYHIFNDEIDKKRFLKIVRSVSEQNNCEIYAFCLLEQEVYFLLGVQNQKSIKHLLNEIILEFQKCKKDSTLTLCSSFQYRKKMSAIEMLEYCRRIHMLPLQKEYVKDLHDYWWSSYRDYVKKYSNEIVNTTMLITHLDENESKAIDKFRKFHENVLQLDCAK